MGVSAEAARSLRGTGAFGVPASHLALAASFTSVLLLAALERSAALRRSRARVVALERLLVMEERHQLDQRRFRRRIDRIHHDMKNHLHAIGALLASGRREEAASYIDTLAGRIDAVAPLVDCANPALAALLSDKLACARRSGVSVESCIMVPAQLGVDRVDLCAVVGNLVDNAVEACERLRAVAPDAARFIDVDIRLCGPVLRIRLENSFDAREPGLARPRRAGRGIGLSSVRAAAAAYGGRVTIEREEGTFRVTALLAYPVRRSGSNGRPGSRGGPS